ncbi:mRNA capping enzyme, putative [Ricinus communis]|uniref:mRNA guanylyltransferase n=1 Tax=Ricinus communis TaxID=3988 RepID=B9SPE2_RICCO|nr:mRNA capping enzyme, putative [Ricinus communis]
MVVTMDLNVSPLPEDEEENFEEHVEKFTAPAEHFETAVETARREREERRKRLRHERSDDRPVHVSRPPAQDQYFPTKHFKTYDKTKLPPGWLDCPASGQEIFGIIPSKVPLGEAYNDCVPPGKRYSFKQVIHQQRVLGRKLGLVIDLTNTTRYYTTTDLKKEGIKHVKIQCRGRDSVPDNASVNSFVYEVTQFFTRQKSKKYVLVHCTHGHNRTGYMVVHYIMRTMSMSVTQAIKLFAEARPPGIYKPDYIKTLYEFYHETKPEMVVCPPTPEWKRSSDLDLNGEAVPDDDDDGGSAAPLHDNHETDAVMTNDDVLGDEVPNDQLDALRMSCYQLLKLNFPVRANPQFPGSHPVSLSRDNLQLLRQRYYYATWKADGTRYLMLIMMDGYTMPDSQKQERRYLIYDVMAINHVSVIEVRRKDFWLLSTVTKLLKEFIPKLSHDADGLIFQGWDDPYVPRTHEGLLKWKYPEMNSVDFLFEVDADDRQLMYLHERGKKKLMDGNTVVFRDGSDPSSYSGKIVECSWDSEEQVWVCMRIRTDKSTPNEFNTFRKVMRSIRDNITEDILLNEIYEIIRLPMYADRIRNESKAHQHTASVRRR